MEGTFQTQEAARVGLGRRDIPGVGKGEAGGSEARHPRPESDGETLSVWTEENRIRFVFQVPVAVTRDADCRVTRMRPWQQLGTDSGGLGTGVGIKRSDRPSELKTELGCGT